MIANKDIYADKDGKITEDPTQYALQVAVAGHELDDRVVKRYGIRDMLVSVDEPSAPRRVKGGASVEIHRIEEGEQEAPAAEAVDTASQEQTEAKQPAKKGAKKKK